MYEFCISLNYCMTSRDSPEKSASNDADQPKECMSPCCNTTCLLYDTPPVGIFALKPKSVDDAILARTENGQRYKLGKGKVTTGNVQAARDLLEREHPQVGRKPSQWTSKLSYIISVDLSTMGAKKITRICSFLSGVGTRAF